MYDKMELKDREKGMTFNKKEREKSNSEKERKYI